MLIRWTQKAKKNLLQVEEYISKDNPKAAITMVLKIINSVAVLSDYPAMGKVGRVFNTRELIIADTPYFVSYRIHVNQIEILRVLHSSMRWP